MLVDNYSVEVTIRSTTITLQTGRCPIEGTSTSSRVTLDDHNLPQVDKYPLKMFLVTENSHLSRGRWLHAFEDHSSSSPSSDNKNTGTSL